MTDRVISWFTPVYPYVGWALFVVGIAMLFVTIPGFAAFGDGVLIYLATIAGELAAIGQGFQMLVESKS